MDLDRWLGNTPSAPEIRRKKEAQQIAQEKLLSIREKKKRGKALILKRDNVLYTINHRWSQLQNREEEKMMFCTFDSSSGNESFTVTTLCCQIWPKNRSKNAINRILYKKITLLSFSLSFSIAKKKNIFKVPMYRTVWSYWSLLQISFATFDLFASFRIACFRPFLLLLFVSF